MSSGSLECYNLKPAGNAAHLSTMHKGSKPLARNLALYKLLDALELFETWFVPYKKLPGAHHNGYSLSLLYNRWSRIRVIRQLKVEGGILFVRIE